MQKRLIVVSLDAVGAKDIEYLRTLPNFKRYMEKAAVCEHVDSVYPSITYPAHTSIVTGRYPCNHGIINNIRREPHRKKQDWYWQRIFVKGTTLYDEVLKNKMKVAAILWPVTAHSFITYNLPEVWSTRGWIPQVYVSAANGSIRYQIDLYKRFGYLMDGVKQPNLDNFAQRSLIYTLKKYKPDLTLAHLTDVDGNRHIYGVDNDEIKKALDRHDERLGEIMDTMDELGWSDNTNLVVLGDHYQIDVHDITYPNYVLLKNGYITVRKGKLVSWRALSWECDGSCYIYIKHKVDIEPVRKLLEKMKADERCGIETIFTHDEAVKMGADKRCSFMLEAKPGFFFQNGWERYVKPVEGKDHKGTHGFLPTKEGYQTFFMAAGPGIRTGYIDRTINLVDEGPTLAKIIGVDLGKTDGTEISELFL